MNRESIAKDQTGWHLSKYFVYAKVPEGDGYAAMDLYQGSFVMLTSMELYLLSIVESLDPSHPAMEKFRKYGLVVDFDQTAAINAYGRIGCGHSSEVSLTICPTMGCNFDCPYCFEEHRAGKMSGVIQDAVVSLAEKMLTSFGADRLHITWFGGEPLLAPEVIEALSQRLMSLAQRKNAAYSAHIITNGYFLTPENTAMLERCCVKSAQITLDGLGAEHDKTRHLAGGQGTFDHITANLRENRLPFTVRIRHNVHQGNLDQIEGLRSFVDRLAKESGNNLLYYSAPVHGNAVMERRGETVSVLKTESSLKEVALRQEAGRYAAHKGVYCSANRISAVAVDDQGRLYKCWEELDKPERSFGDVSSWDPDDPVRSAQRKDLLTAYLNTCCPVPDPECRDCLWLPMCCGGCPGRRLNGENVCYSFRKDPEAFALAVYRALNEKDQKQRESAEPLC